MNKLLVIVFISIRIIYTFFNALTATYAFIVNDRRIKTVLIFYKINMLAIITCVTPGTNAGINNPHYIIHNNGSPRV